MRSRKPIGRRPWPITQVSNTLHHCYIIIVSITFLECKVYQPLSFFSLFSLSSSPPDRHATATPEEREKEEVIFKEVSEAYQVLSDSRRKHRYDSGQDLEDNVTTTHTLTLPIAMFTFFLLHSLYTHPVLLCLNCFCSFNVRCLMFPAS